MNKSKTKKYRTSFDAECRRLQCRFFALLKECYYAPTKEGKKQAYSDLGITSIKKLTFTEMHHIISRLQNIADKMPGKTEKDSKENFIPSNKEYFEDWRIRLFPANVIAFGKNPRRDIISKREQDFIIFLAMRIFKNLESFLSWLKRWTGFDLISFSWQANQVCRGLVPMGERLGLNVAPPAGSRDRELWEKYEELKRKIK